jgi:hypothetical protein
MKRKETHLIGICVAVDMADMGVLLVARRPPKQPPAKNAPPRLLQKVFHNNCQDIDIVEIINP